MTQLLQECSLDSTDASCLPFVPLLSYFAGKLEESASGNEGIMHECASLTDL